MKRIVLLLLAVLLAGMLAAVSEESEPAAPDVRNLENDVFGCCVPDGWSVRDNGSSWSVTDPATGLEYFIFERTYAPDFAHETIEDLAHSSCLMNGGFPYTLCEAVEGGFDMAFYGETDPINLKTGAVKFCAYAVADGNVMLSVTATPEPEADIRADIIAIGETMYRVGEPSGTAAQSE